MSRADDIRHPGPRGAVRQHVVPGVARRITLRLPAGRILMDAVAEAMDRLGCHSAMLVLDGLVLGPHNYVMPLAGSPDGKRVAWYSETHTGTAAILEHAVASVGRRKGEWFLHCHAVWDSADGQRAGHLLPGEVTIGADSDVTCFAFEGGQFDVVDDAETGFSIFRALPLGSPPGAPNAAIATLAPFEDLVGTMPGLAARAIGRLDAQFYGLGSLIGADFEDGAPSMESRFSEVLTLPGARTDRIPVHCVDPAGGMFRGTLLPGAAPTLITFELMVVSPDL
ncbi:hypothetical protein [Acuticoccus kandeliae]|uniref:hypothetical protein n=1 Tax=Acuticoccus kandeliae TaxID=2073160 RepID=UPI000D3E919D|nr:hypothetical protein [Acuticoccus kandeliae]